MLYCSCLSAQASNGNFQKTFHIICFTTYRLKLYIGWLPELNSERLAPLKRRLGFPAPPPPPAVLPGGVVDFWYSGAALRRWRIQWFLPTWTSADDRPSVCSWENSNALRVQELDIMLSFVQYLWVNMMQVGVTKQLYLVLFSCKLINIYDNQMIWYSFCLINTNLSNLT